MRASHLVSSIISFTQDYLRSKATVTGTVRPTADVIAIDMDVLADALRTTIKLLTTDIPVLMNFYDKDEEVYLDIESANLADPAVADLVAEAWEALGFTRRDSAFRLTLSILPERAKHLVMRDRPAILTEMTLYMRYFSKL